MIDIEFIVRYQEVNVNAERYFVSPPFAHGFHTLDEATEEANKLNEQSDKYYVLNVLSGSNYRDDYSKWNNLWEGK